MAFIPPPSCFKLIIPGPARNLPTQQYLRDFTFNAIGAFSGDIFISCCGASSLCHEKLPVCGPQGSEGSLALRPKRLLSSARSSTPAGLLRHATWTPTLLQSAVCLVWVKKWRPLCKPAWSLSRLPGLLNWWLDGTRSKHPKKRRATTSSGTWGRGTSPLVHLGQQVSRRVLPPEHPRAGGGRRMPFRKQYAPSLGRDTAALLRCWM